MIGFEQIMIGLVWLIGWIYEVKKVLLFHHQSIWQTYMSNEQYCEHSTDSAWSIQPAPRPSSHQAHQKPLLCNSSCFSFLTFMNNNNEHHDQLEVEELGGPPGPNFWALLLVSCFWPPCLSHIIPLPHHHQSHWFNHHVWLTKFQSE